MENALNYFYLSIDMWLPYVWKVQLILSNFQIVNGFVVLRTNLFSLTLCILYIINNLKIFILRDHIHTYIFTYFISRNWYSSKHHQQLPALQSHFTATWYSATLTNLLNCLIFHLCTYKHSHMGTGRKHCQMSKTIWSAHKYKFNFT